MKNRFDLILLAAHRAHELGSGERPVSTALSDNILSKNTMIAIDEIMTGAIDIEELRSRALVKIARDMQFVRTKGWASHDARSHNPSANDFRIDSSPRRESNKASTEDKQPLSQDLNLASLLEDTKVNSKAGAALYSSKKIMADKKLDIDDDSDKKLDIDDDASIDEDEEGYDDEDYDDDDDDYDDDPLDDDLDDDLSDDDELDDFDDEEDEEV